MLIFGESLLIALIGGIVGVAVTFPIANGSARRWARCSRILHSDATVAMQLGAAVLVGLVAAALPAWRAAHVRIVEALHAVG
jgi:putative ABC transport system permease protein